jgi:hypothetical protein
LHQSLHTLDAELADKGLRVGVGVIQRGDDRGAARDQWPTCPPYMQGKMGRQGGRHAPLPLRLGTHLMAWETALDQTLLLSVHTSSAIMFSYGDKKSLCPMPACIQIARNLQTFDASS